MLSQNADLYLIRRTLDELHHLVDQLELQRQHIALQGHRLDEVEKQCQEIKNMYQKLQNTAEDQQDQIEECQKSINCVIPSYRYLKDRNADLEALAAFYSQD